MAVGDGGGEPRGPLYGEYAADYGFGGVVLTTVFLRAQDEPNSRVPAEHRGEVSAAFVCCIYVLVGGSVVAIGLLEELAGLTAGVVLVGGVLTVLAVVAAWWQSRTQLPSGA